MLVRDLTNVQLDNWPAREEAVHLRDRHLLLWVRGLLLLCLFHSLLAKLEHGIPKHAACVPNSDPGCLK